MPTLTDRGIFQPTFCRCERCRAHWERAGSDPSETAAWYVAPETEASAPRASRRMLDWVEPDLDSEHGD